MHLTNNLPHLSDIFTQWKQNASLLVSPWSSDCIFILYCDKFLFKPKYNSALTCIHLISVKVITQMWLLIIQTDTITVRNTCKFNNNAHTTDPYTNSPAHWKSKKASFFFSFKRKNVFTTNMVRSRYHKGERTFTELNSLQRKPVSKDTKIRKEKQKALTTPLSRDAPLLPLFMPGAVTQNQHTSTLSTVATLNMCFFVANLWGSDNNPNPCPKRNFSLLSSFSNGA